MRRTVPRPCGPAKLVDLTPEYRGGWGAALEDDPVPWDRFAPLLEFDSGAVIRSDEDWNRYVLDPAAGVALRYVLVFVGSVWELRLGRTRADSTLERGGSHRHMFSIAEQQNGLQNGKTVRSGYVYGISSSEIVID